MDVKLFKRFIITELIIISIFIRSTTTLDAQLFTDDGTSECTRDIKGISLTTLDGQLFGQPGPKGDKGITGFCGSKGTKGEMGESGLRGQEGLKGPIGQRGRRGKKGEIGSEGIKGIKGPNGDRGDLGIQGREGEKGERGDDDIGPKGLPGASGLVGLPGSDGPPGICTCDKDNINEDNDDYEVNDYEFATQENPAKALCKFFPLSKKTGIYYLKDPSNHIMKVYCNMETLETCLISNIKFTKYFYTGINSEENKIKNLTKEGSFWLSDRIEMKKLYGVRESQIIWLQTWSSSVKQRLRYHCNNSIPYSRSDITSSVQLLTWNDKVIGPYPSDETPFFYSVPEETNHCLKNSNTEQYSEIVLQSTIVYRLPIIDIQIRDIREEIQMFYLENVELCFI